MGRDGEAALTPVGAADAYAHQSIGKLVLSSILQRFARCQGQRRPLHEVAWARQKSPAKTRYANAVWK
jgi:hypothetical protein